MYQEQANQKLLSLAILPRKIIHPHLFLKNGNPSLKETLPLKIFIGRKQFPKHIGNRSSETMIPIEENPTGSVLSAY